MPSILSKDMMPHARAARLTAHYGKNKTRIPLSELGIGNLNRSVSWKYVHSKALEIIEIEGFAESRYKWAIAVEPPKDDPLQSTRRTQQEAQFSGNKLPTVDNRQRYGLLTKNHLLFVLLMLENGRIHKDHKPTEVWQLPEKTGTRDKNDELFEVMERGLLVVVLKSAIFENEELEDIKLIIDVDNADSYENRADHEIHMFKNMRNAIGEVEWG